MMVAIRVLARGGADPGAWACRFVGSLVHTLIPRTISCGNRSDELSPIFLHTTRLGFGGGSGAAFVLHLAFSFLFRGHKILRRAGAQLAGARRVRALCARRADFGGHARTRISGIPCGDLFRDRAQCAGGDGGAGVRGSRDLRPCGADCREVGASFPARCGRQGGAVDGGAVPLHRGLHGGGAHRNAGHFFYDCGGAGICTIFWPRWPWICLERAASDSSARGKAVSFAAGSCCWDLSQGSELWCGRKRRWC